MKSFSLTVSDPNRSESQDLAKCEFGANSQQVRSEIAPNLLDSIVAKLKIRLQPILLVAAGISPTTSAQPQLQAPLPGNTIQNASIVKPSIFEEGKDSDKHASAVAAFFTAGLKAWKRISIENQIEDKLAKMSPWEGVPIDGSSGRLIKVILTHAGDFEYLHSVEVVSPTLSSSPTKTLLKSKGEDFLRATIPDGLVYDDERSYYLWASYRLGAPTLNRYDARSLETAARIQEQEIENAPCLVSPSESDHLYGGQEMPSVFSQFRERQQSLMEARFRAYKDELNRESDLEAARQERRSAEERDAREASKAFRANAAAERDNVFRKLDDLQEPARMARDQFHREGGGSARSQLDRDQASLNEQMEKTDLHGQQAISDRRARLEQQRAKRKEDAEKAAAIAAAVITGGSSIPITEAVSAASKPQSESHLAAPTLPQYPITPQGGALPRTPRAPKPPRPKMHPAAPKPENPLPPGPNTGPTWPPIIP